MTRTNGPRVAWRPMVALLAFLPAIQIQAQNPEPRNEPRNPPHTTPANRPQTQPPANRPQAQPNVPNRTPEVRPQIPNRSTPEPQGRSGYAPPAGRNVPPPAHGGPAPNRAPVYHLSRPGMDAHFGADGRLNSAHLVRADRSQLIINHGPHGERVVQTIRPDGSRVVTLGRNYGYVERPLRAGYMQRTYVAGGRVYVRVYRPYAYGGIRFFGYVPPVTYSPAFYGWMVRPWGPRVGFGWGFVGLPWFGFYRGYFVPAPYYPAPAYWMTDYMFAQSLQTAYVVPGPGMPPQPPPMAPMPPDARQGVVNSVQQEVQDQQQQPPAPVPGGPSGGWQPIPPTGQPPRQPVTPDPSQPAPFQSPGGQPDPGQPPVSDKKPFYLNPSERDLPVSTVTTLDMPNGQTCSLSPGSVIHRQNEIVQGNSMGISVASSLPGDCPIGTVSKMDLKTLQDVHLQFEEQTDLSEQLLARSQGQGGLPGSPAPNPQATPGAQPPPDPSAGPSLQQQKRDADQAEQQIKQTQQQQ